MGSIPIKFQYFVEKSRNNKYSWGMFAGLIGLFLLYGALINYAPRLLRRKRDMHPNTHRRYSLAIRLWRKFNTTFRFRLPWFGTFYIQTTMLLALLLYLAWLVAMVAAQTTDITYQPRSYIIGKRVGKIAVGNMPLLMLFITKNDVLTFLTGWPAHYLTMLHMWMGRIIYFMMVTHVALTAHYWISLHYYVMIVIPPQIIGMIGFGSMTMLFLLSPGLIRRLSYEFFLFNHGFFSFIMFLAGFLHNNAAKAGILLAVHLLAIDRVVLLIRAGINYWCTKPNSAKASFEIVDPETIKIVIPIENRDFKIGSRKIKTCGDWKPGQHIYLKVPTARRFEWHPFTIASLKDSREMLVIMKVYKGFTKKLLRVITEKCEKESSTSCELRTWFHGPYGATLSPLIDFDTAVFVAGGTGASFTFPLALDLIKAMSTQKEKVRCKRVKFAWYIRTRKSIDWYESILTAMRETIGEDTDISVSIDIFVTQEHTEKIDEESLVGCECSIPNSETIMIGKEDRVFGDFSKKHYQQSSISSTLFNIELGKPRIQDLVEQEITQQCHLLGEGSFKDIAVLSCGPSALVNEAAFEAERQERRNKNLSVYCYMEKYVV